MDLGKLHISANALARQRGVVWGLRCERLGRAAYRVGSFPELSIFGCYDGGNVGDLALGLAVKGIASRLARTAFDTPKLSRRLVPPRAVVLAGGGVITTRPGSPLLAFSDYVARRPCAISAIGVSAVLGESELPEAAFRTLRNAAWLSTRSATSARELSRILGREDIVVQPDIAFALPLAVEAVQPQSGRRERRLLINVSPFLHSRRGHEFVPHTAPSAWFSKHLPDQAAWYDRIGPRYVSMVDALVAKFIDQGWEVVSVPLAPEDDLFARSILRNRPVRHLAYDSDPRRVLEHFATAERALVTRFHAHVFALLTSTPLGSFAYSPKCTDLLSELGLSSDAQAQPRDWVHDFDATLERLSSERGKVLLDEATLRDLQAQTYDLTRRGVLAALDRD